MRHRAPVRLALAAVLGAGCSAPRGGGASPPDATARPVDPDAHAFYDAEGHPASFEAFVAGLAEVDFVAFGEFHDHPVASRYELALLEAMAAQPRPVALAMEFFETDMQADLDRYLAGEIDEATFRERTRRNDRYDASHRPLIEFCRRNGIPVLAANAPRRLVRAYRKSGAESYQAFLASLPPEDRALLPPMAGPRDEAFEARFMEFMGPERGPAFYPSMALWNDAMADSVARFRTEHPDHRVLLVVGGFHVAGHLGTITQYRARRPDDSVRVLLMVAGEGGDLRFSEDDRGEGDLLLKVVPHEPGG